MKDQKKGKKEAEPLTFPRQFKSDMLSRVITLVDGYRILHTGTFGKIDKNVSKGVLGRRFAEKWREIRKVLWKMGTYPDEIPKVRKLTTIRIFTGLLATFMMIGGSILMLIIIFASLGRFMLFVGAMVYIGGGTLLGFSILIRRRVAIIMEDYYRERPDLWRKEREYLKDIVQGLIFAMVRFVRRQRREGLDKSFRKDPDKAIKKYKIELFNMDYKGINIIKKPGRLKKKFIAVPEMG
ncbi:MAG: hypothetical protein ACFE7E_02375 [Candidatus Hodarchaeota archaeon]